MKTVRLASVVSLVLGMLLLTGAAFAQAVDPGVRGGAPNAGGALPGLDSDEQAFFNAARSRFQEVDSVSGNVPGENGVGLGPGFNSNSCSSCHAAPAVGGSSPAINPQIAAATDAGATNTIPSFITLHGPTREARFVNNPDGTPDGGVHDLFSIAGRSDASGCGLAQPDFATNLANNNVIFRTPTPTFGAGLIENTPDAVLESNLAANGFLKSLMGISGHLNRSGNDGTVTRFGWKAQNKSLLIFAGEAYNVEQGVANEVFPNERNAVAGCIYNGTPEDSTNLANSFNSGSNASDYSSDTVNFAAFMRLSAPPAPAPATASTSRGQVIFEAIGCALCHTETLNTTKSAYSGQNNQAFHPFSDIAVHDMGTGLQDRVSQGNANGRQFRSAPLWGVGQRLFFFHDGRTGDLVSAIHAHRSNGSEANITVDLYDLIGSNNQQDLLNFLRSL
ncbi:MAG TPA: di-heme oxidoredictase family protein [Candidatus Angelobacter sp.]|nr:di-heme oxidoredictase family protein [Candidatus Angelobacter sp.]